MRSPNKGLETDRAFGTAAQPRRWVARIRTMRRITITILLFVLVAASRHLWALSIIPEEFSAPSLFGKLLLFSKRTGTKLFAIDKQSREMRWIWSTGDRSVRTRPTIVDGVAYIWAGRGDSRACAVDCTTGKSIWETPTTGDTEVSAIIVDEVVLFAAITEKREIHAFDRKTGRKLWSLLDNYNLLLANANVLLAIARRGTLGVILEASTGKILFQVPLTDKQDIWWSLNASCCSAEGIAVIGGQGFLLALDVNKKQVVWEVETDSYPHPNRKDYPHPVQTRWVSTIYRDKVFLLATHFPPLSPPRSAGKHDQLIEVRNLSDGRIVVRRTLIDAGRYVRSHVFEDIVVIEGSPGLMRIDPESLRVRWRFDANETYETFDTARVGTSVYIGGGKTFFTPYRWVPHIWEIDATTGKKLWVYPEETQQLNAPDKK